MHPDMYDEIFAERKKVDWDVYWELYQAYHQTLEDRKRQKLWMIKHIDELTELSKEDKLMKFHEEVKRIDRILDFADINLNKAKKGVTNG